MYKFPFPNLDSHNQLVPSPCTAAFPFSALRCAAALLQTHPHLVRRASSRRLISPSTPAHGRIYEATIPLPFRDDACVARSATSHTLHHFSFLAAPRPRPSRSPPPPRHNLPLPGAPSRKGTG